jgi:uncharacterized membrane protein YesL
MLTGLIGVIVALVVIGLLFYCVSLLPLPEPYMTIIRVIFIIIAILYLLSFLTGHAII